MHPRFVRSIGVAAVAAAAVAWMVTAPAGARVERKSRPHRSTTTTSSTTSSTTTTTSSTTTTVAGGCPAPGSTTGGFCFGQLQQQTAGATGCGTNIDGEPAVRVARDDNVVVASEEGLGGGSDAWHGSAGAAACGLTYDGQPNAVIPGVGVSGGDVDVAIGSAPASSGQYPIYLSSGNVGSVAVAHSTDGGNTYSNVPVVAGIPGTDRPWIAAYGSSTALLSYHDLATNDIDVLRSDDGGTTFKQISMAIPLSNPASGNNEIGNMAIDHRNTSGAATGQFWAYQSYVASADGSSLDTAYVAVSTDGGSSWTDKSIPCSINATDLDHQFPNVSVAPDGTVWVAWSDDTNVFAASSADHGTTWQCSRVSTSSSTEAAIMPWIAAGSNGVDLVYYGTQTTKNQTWSVFFAQNNGSSWGSPQQLFPVHTGSVCETGATCIGGRQLYDDFGVDVDLNGMAHIAYSHDSPDLGGSGTYTGYAVQQSGSGIGFNN